MQIAKGDERAFKIVFESAHPIIYQAALLVTASPHLAEEVVQDVFLKLWIKRSDLPSNLSLTRQTKSDLTAIQ